MSLSLSFSFSLTHTTMFTIIPVLLPHSYIIVERLLNCQSLIVQSSAVNKEALVPSPILLRHYINNS